VNDEADNSTEEPRAADVGDVGGATAGDIRTTPGQQPGPERGYDLKSNGDELALPGDELALSGDASDVGESDVTANQEQGDEELVAQQSDGEPAQLATVGDEAAVADSAVGAVETTPPEPRKLEWFILKVQSNREDSIRESLMRRIAVAGLGDCFDQIIVPIERVSEFKNGKKRTVKRKLYPGYLVVHMEYNDDTWYLVRETPGIGDFTGSGGKPTPMAQHEVNKIMNIIEPEKPDETPRINIPYKKGDRVKINEGTFENFEGDVDHIDEANGRVTVMINIFGRSTPVELEYWQIEKL
jgi:transcriptional antiterminator NusG